MPSSALRSRDLRAIFELAHDARDLGDDTGVWRRHWFAGIARLIGADIAVGGELAGLMDEAPRTLGSVDWGWEHGFDRAGWLRALELMRDDPAYSPMMIEYGRRLRGREALALSRTDMVADRDWYSSVECDQVFRTMGTDHHVWACATLPGCNIETDGGVYARATGRRDFSGRDKAVIAAAQATIVRWVGGPLARFDEPSPAALPPRVRAVLRCVLEGDSDKQIAARLKISKYTVNQYTRVIYTHFGVVSRAELLARWVRRGWPQGFSW